MELKLQNINATTNTIHPLIVPYGIETVYSAAKHLPDQSFNCTLWN